MNLVQRIGRRGSRRMSSGRQVLPVISSPPIVSNPIGKITDAPWSRQEVALLDRGHATVRAARKAVGG